MRYLASIPAVRRRPDVAGVPVAYTPMHGVGGDVVAAAFERAGLRSGRSSSPSSMRPTPPSRPLRSRTRRSRGRWTSLIALGRRARRRAWRSPTTPTPTGSVRRSRSPTARGGDSAATRSGGCSPTTCSPTRSGDDRVVITTLVSSSLLGDDGGVGRRALRRDVHRVQVDRAHDPRPSRVAVRARLRAGARLPRGATPARQGRHLGGRAAGRDRRRRRGRGHDAARPTRRDRRTLRTSRHRRPSVRMDPAAAAGRR